MNKRIVTIIGMFVILLCSKYQIFAATSLSAGDIAFVGANSDGDDEFAFLLLKDITSGTTIRISDQGWNDGSGFFDTFGDGIWQWTTSSALSAGTIVHIKTTNNGIIEDGSLAASPGTVSWVYYTSTAISYTGDQVFLYQGSEASPTFIAACHWNVEAGSTTDNWDGVANSNKTSALPNQLTNGTNAIWLYAPGPLENDNFRYKSSSTTSGSPAILRAAINNIANWDKNNDTAYELNPFPFSFTVNTTQAPTISTSAATSITASGAALGGDIISNGGATVTARGVVFSSTDTNPEIGDAKVTQDVNDSGLDTFSEAIGSLAPGITYYFQAYATNSVGTSYGGVLNFTTSDATITFTDGSGFTPDVTQGGTDQLLGRFYLSANVAGASLTAASIQLNGTRTGLSNLKLWSSADAGFSAGGDTQLGSTVAADPGDGASASFSGFNSVIATSGSYYFLTGDVASNATGVVQGMLYNSANLTLDKGYLGAPISNDPLSNGDASLPVELVSFSAEPDNGAVVLQWTTASEIDNLGFIIERRSKNREWQQIASYVQNEQLTGQGTKQTSTPYCYQDASVIAGHKYSYRLSEVSTHGETSVIATTEVETVVTPITTRLFAAYPNPFNPQTTLKYQLTQDSHMTLVIYDVLGRQIKLLANQQQAAGEYTATWDGTTNAGLDAPSGTYLARLQAAGMQQTRKILFLK